jgi:D-alanyl-D-alanine carboxypeptidase
MPFLKGSLTRRVLILILTVAIFMAATVDPADAARKKSRKHKQQTQAQTVNRSASIVIDAATGYVLSESNADKRLYPASLTKMMTLYLTFEMIDSGRLRKSDRIPVSRRAEYQEPSELGLVAGSTVRVEDAILGLVTKSANDAAVTLAEKIGGSEDSFARLMTRKARMLGMNNTNFVNASGLHNPSQYSSARDMAILGQALVRDFPRHYRYFSTSSFTYAGRAYANHNHLMKSYDGMDGIKTGYVYASGYNLVASAVRNQHRLIGVVFGGQTSKSRNNAMAKLLDEGFETLSNPRIAARVAAKPAAVASNVTQVASRARAIAPAAGTPSAELSERAPAFDAMGLATDDSEEGDADEVGDVSAMANRRDTATANRRVSLVKTTQNFEPRSLNTSVQLDENQETDRLDGTRMALSSASAREAGEVWLIQVGAFSTHDASIAALRSAHTKLPAAISSNSKYVIAPLMTNRGMIYRARLSGLARDQATQACRVLQGNCLVLTAQ